MSVIRYPLSGRKEFVDISLYKDYADTSYRNLEAKRYFETVVVCSIGLDVLLNTIPDRIITFSVEQVDGNQKSTLERIERSRFTSGKLIQKFKRANILDRRLVRALERLDEERNKIMHPFQGGQMKSETVWPSSTSEEYARKVFRLFCHVIDLAAGRSPYKEKKELDQYIKWRRQVRAAHFAKSHKGIGGPPA